MRVFAISDLHLALGIPEKSMEVFGDTWKNYAQRIAISWKEKVRPEDLVLIPGDISWAMTLEEALIDLSWIDSLPGTKVILKGNHDYWWPSSKKLQAVMPPSIHFIHNNALTIGSMTIGGSRLWDTKEYDFHRFIQFQENPREEVIVKRDQSEESAKIFERELGRLRLSLSQLSQSADVRIALTHYPPIGADLAPSRVAMILEEFRIDYCIFGHLHNVRKGSLPFGKARGVTYLFTSSDALEFTPLLVLGKERG